MSDDITDAIENARSAGLSARTWAGSKQRLHSSGMVRAIFVSLLRDLPEEITVRDLREALDL